MDKLGSLVTSSIAGMLLAMGHSFTAFLFMMIAALWINGSLFGEEAEDERI